MEVPLTPGMLSPIFLFMWLITTNRFISLQHDLFEITVDLAVGYFLDAALNHTPKFNVRFLLIYALQNG